VNVSDSSLPAANYGTGSSDTFSWADAYAQAFGTTDGSDVETVMVSEDSDSETLTDVVSSSACSRLGLSLMVGMLLAGFLLMRLDE
jgi:hypothetical protein